MVPLDSSLSPSPSFKNTWFISLVRSLIARVVPESSSAPIPVNESQAQTTEAEETDEASASDAGPVKPNGVAVAAVKAGGRRRKAVPKRK